MGAGGGGAWVGRAPRRGPELQPDGLSLSPAALCVLLCSQDGAPEGHGPRAAAGRLGVHYSRQGRVRQGVAVAQGLPRAGGCRADPVIDRPGLTEPALLARHPAKIPSCRSARQAFVHPIKAIAFDGPSRAWVGDDSGRIKVSRRRAERALARYYGRSAAFLTSAFILSRFDFSSGPRPGHFRTQAGRGGQPSTLARADGQDEGRGGALARPVRQAPLRLLHEHGREREYARGAPAQHPRRLRGRQRCADRCGAAPQRTLGTSRTWTADMGTFAECV